MTIYTRDLQAAHQRVQTARRAQPFDRAAYDAAYSDYLALIQAWAQEGRETANDARLRRQIEQNEAAILQARLEIEDLLGE